MDISDQPAAHPVSLCELGKAPLPLDSGDPCPGAAWPAEQGLASLFPAPWQHDLEQVLPVQLSTKFGNFIF